MANGLFAGGNGTVENPYLIEDAFDLDAVRNDLTAHYKLVKDIDLNVSPFNKGVGWKPIGVTHYNTPVLGVGHSFLGTFDGNGKTIKNLYHNSLNSGIGIFASITGNAVVKSVKVENVNITHGSSSNTDRNYRAGIVGFAGGNSVIRECVVLSGIIEGRWQISGIAGASTDNAIIQNCYSDVDLRTIVPHAATSGIADIKDSSAKIINCYSLSRGLKGIVNLYDGSVTVTNCFWDVEVSGTDVSDGGIGLKTEQMKKAQTFIDAEWHKELNDSGRFVWVLRDGKYPKLWFESDYKHLIKSNNKYYTYQNNEFIEVEPTVENFKGKSIYLTDLITLTDKVVLTTEGGYELEDGKIYRKTINTNKYKRIITGNIK